MSTINSNAGYYDFANSTNTPLNSGDIFEGVFGSCLNFSTIEVSLKTDTIYDLSIIYSPDAVNDEYIQTESVVVVSADTLFYKFEPKMRYYRLKLENTDASNQSFLSLQSLCKSSFVYEPVSGGGGGTSNVNIVSPLSGGAVSVSVSNFPATQPVSGSISVSNFPATQPISGSISVSNFPATQPVSNSDITNIYNIVNSRGSATLWSASPTGAGGFSNILDLSTKNIKNLSIYGNCNGATVLTVQFSNDGSNFYDTQYSYTLSGAGDLGFNLTSCPYYVRLKSSLNITATVIVNYC